MQLKCRLSQKLFVSLHRPNLSLRADGGQLHYGKSDTVRFVFGDLNYHIKSHSKTIAEVTPTGVYIRNRGVPGVLVPSRTLSVHQYILSAWVSTLFVLMGWLW